MSGNMQGYVGNRGYKIFRWVEKIMKNTILFLVCAFLLPASLTEAVTGGQIDEFEIDANSLNWVGGKQPAFSPEPNQVPDGGPNGVGDGYLQISVSGYHLGTYNTEQWSGDYITAGINGIAMDVNRTAGPSDVSLRILLFGPGGTWASTNLAPTLTGSGWQHIVFSLKAADMTHVTGSAQVPDGTGVLQDTLAGVTKLLIRHDSVVPTVPGHHPPHITATLGIDNIVGYCRFAPLGDVNNDCRVDFLDVALMAGNWLIDCSLDSANPACLDQ